MFLVKNSQNYACFNVNTLLPTGNINQHNNGTTNWIGMEQKTSKETVTFGWHLQTSTIRIDSTTFLIFHRLRSHPVYHPSTVTVPTRAHTRFCMFGRSACMHGGVYLLSYLSRMQAWARPPSAQAVSSAYRWPSRCSLLLAVVTRRAPVCIGGAQRGDVCRCV
jgi:hypothetical protein